MEAESSRWRASSDAQLVAWLVAGLLPVEEFWAECRRRRDALDAELGLRRPLRAVRPVWPVAS